MNFWIFARMFVVMLFGIRRVFAKMGVVDKWLGFFVVFGSAIVLVSLFRGILQGSKLEVVQTNLTETGELKSKSIFVDIEGAVVSPGVYEMSLGERIKDVLVKAGGFSEKADRVYAQKTINLAEQLKDAQKIYIPFLSDTPGVPGYVEPKNTQLMVNVNTASVDVLDTLWGIGETRANNIVKNRPYTSLEEMVEKRVITTQILERNKNVMVVY